MSIGIGTFGVYQDFGKYGKSDGYEAESLYGKSEEADDEFAINEDHRKKNGRKSSPEECQTCKNRRYQDGSDEMVSFKTPGKITPGESYAKVRSHEQEHVANAVAEGNKPGKELVSASVSLKTAICPECGRAYIAGGTTRTMMKTYGSDPYSKNQKSFEQEATKGNNIDAVA